MEQPKIDCHLFPNRCSRTIKNKDKSCYSKCNVYQDNYDMLIPHINKFDTTPFDEKQTIVALNKINNIEDCLKYWFDNHYTPLFQWIIDLNIEPHKKDILIKYQTHLRYDSMQSNYFSIGISPLKTVNLFDYDMMMDWLHIPYTIYSEFYKGWENDPDSSYLIFKYEAKLLFEIQLRYKWQDLFTKTNSIQEIKRELNRLQQIEVKAYSLYDTRAIQTSIHNQIPRSEYNKYRNEIEILRIKENYYKKNSIYATNYSRSINQNALVSLYSYHIYLKAFLETELNKLQQQSTMSLGKDKNPIEEKKLTLKEIALIYIYNDTPISKQNNNDIAQKYEHQSGHKLYQHYNKYRSKTQRTGAEDTAKKTENKINLIKGIIKHLNNQEQAKSDLEALTNNYNIEYS